VPAQNVGVLGLVDRQGLVHPGHRTLVCPICAAVLASNGERAHDEWHRQLRLRGAEPLGSSYYVPDVETKET